MIYSSRFTVILDACVLYPAPDEFVNLLNKLNPSIVKQAFENQLASLKNPPVSKEKLIKTLEKCGLENASKLFT